MPEPQILEFISKLEALLPALGDKNLRLAGFLANALRCSAADPHCCAVHLRCFIEHLVRLVLGTEGEPRYGHGGLHNAINSQAFKQEVGADIQNHFELLSVGGNDGAHGQALSQPLAKLLDSAATISIWFTRSHNFSGAPSAAKSAPILTGATSSATPGGKREFDEGDCIFVIRHEQSSTLLKVVSGIPELIRQDAPLLLFGEDDVVWEWVEQDARMPVVATRNIDELWEADNPAVELGVAYVPVRDAYLLDLKTGKKRNSLLSRKYDAFTLDPTSGQTGLFESMGWIRETNLLPSVGSWVLRLDLDNQFHGGAHNHWSCNFECVDALERGEVDLALEIRELVDRNPELHAHAMRQWIAENVQDDSGDTPAKLDLTKFECNFNGNGALSLVLQFTGETYFANSDGRWDAYTRSVEISTGLLPPSLQKYAQLPVAVADWLADHPLKIVGWSRLSLNVEGLLMARLESYDGW